MDLLVDRPQLVKVVKSYLTRFFGDLTPKKDKVQPNSVFYLDSNNDVMIEYDEKYGDAYVHHYYIWSKLESYFPIKPRDIQLILNDWLKEHYKLENLKLTSTDRSSIRTWRYVTI